MDENNEIIIYQSDNCKTWIEIKHSDETVWLSQQQLCDLYGASKANVSEHIKHICENGELEEESVVRKFRTTVADGKLYNATYYNLDMIISLGYRIRDICSSEKVMYRQVLNLYATAVDYGPYVENSVKLFKIIPQKLYYATHGQTAAEVIYHRSSSTSPMMRLTSFNGDYLLCKT